MGIMFETPIHQQYGRAVFLILYEDGKMFSKQTSVVCLPINPEDFSFERPERVNVTQTLGEPFVDEFGTGLATIRINGTTGWRTRLGIPSFTFGTSQAGLIDGYEAYRLLHREIEDKYFKLRAKLLDGGMDPDTVKLLMINTVDNQVFDVIPQEFRLRRSKSRPLLYQYDLSFIVREDLSEMKIDGIPVQGIFMAMDAAQLLLGMCDTTSVALGFLGSNVIQF